MLLLSVEEEKMMSAEIYSEEKTQSYNFILQNQFTNDHQINLVVEDKHKQHAIFVTQSIQANVNAEENKTIDSVTLLKIFLNESGFLEMQQVAINLPVKANVKMFC